MVSITTAEVGEVLVRKLQTWNVFGLFGSMKTDVNWDKKNTESHEIRDNHEKTENIYFK